MDMYDILLAQQLGSGGGGGTTNYNALSNKPQINGVPLQGDKSFGDLGLGTAAEKDYTTTVEDGSADLPTGDAVHDFVAAQVAYIDNSIDDVREQVDTIRDIVNTELYGFKIDKQDSNPATRVTYLYDAVGKTPAHMDYTDEAFDYGDWADAWFIRENKPCALRYNGTVAYYLNPNDYTQKEDGTASDVSDGSFEGNFMAQLPTIWVKRWEDDNYLYTAISNRQIDSGFKAYAHDAGDGYVNDYIYLPMFKGVIDTNGKLRSYAGHIPYNGARYTAAQELTAIAQCGTGWQGWDLLKWRTLGDLCTLISKNTNSQAAFGGGDGSTFESSSSGGMLPTGENNLTTGQFNGYNDLTHHVKVFHVEDFWGNRTDRCYGAHTVNGVYVYKTHPPYSAEPDGTYINSGIEAPEVGAVGGWIKSENVGDFGLLPSEAGGSSTTYYCDYLWENHEGTRLCAIGGMDNHFNNIGAYFMQFNHEASLLNAWVGSSPLYNPPHSGYDDKVDEEVFDYVQPQIDTIREILGVELYGFRIDKQDSNPETRVTYMYDAAGKAPAHMNYTSGTFDYGDWGNAWFIRENKPCALKYDGSIDYYLNPNDYTKKADGTASDVSDSSYAGNFMASMPTIWVKRWEDSRYIYTALSNKQINNSYHAYAHDAGDGFINDFIYLPMFKGAVIDSKLRSIAGVTPGGMTTAAQDKTNAEANGSGWQTWDWSKHCLITDLLTLISKSTNSQPVFGGGAADTQDDEDTQTHGMLTTGTSGSGQFYGTNDFLHHVKVFHIEDYWGNRFDTCLGLNRVNGDYMCKAIRPYDVNSDNTYTNVGTAPTSYGWAKSISINEYGWVPSEVGATASTYYCDEVNIGTVSVHSLARICGMNGNRNGCGTYDLHISRLSSDTLWFFGASPVYNAEHSS